MSRREVSHLREIISNDANVDFDFWVSGRGGTLCVGAHYATDTRADKICAALKAAGYGYERTGKPGTEGVHTIDITSMPN